MLLAAPVFLSVVLASIIRVPADHPTIQGGIDAAANGDTVLVDPGTYFESVDFYGKNIVLGSLFLITGDTSYVSQTVIDGSRSRGSAATFANGEDSTAVLAGFTLTHGRASIGGGIYCNRSNPTLVHLIVTGNRAEYAGGVGCYESSPTLINVIIHGNVARWSSALYCHRYSSPKLVNVSVTANRTTFQAGWIYCHDYSSPTFVNVTISANTSNGEEIAGIFCSNDSHPTFENAILWNDSDNEIILRQYGLPSSVTLSYCNVRSGEDAIVAAENGNIVWPQGNIDADPLFVDLDNNDFRLKRNSPSIDAGNPSSEYTDPDGSRNDMGAFGGPRTVR